MFGRLFRESFGDVWKLLGRFGETKIQFEIENNVDTTHNKTNFPLGGLHDKNISRNSTNLGP